MVRPAETVRELYELARRADREGVRMLLHDDAVWEPARQTHEPCQSGEEVARSLLWRASAHRLRTGQAFAAGDRVVVRLHGRRLEFLGSGGFLRPSLFQLVVFREGRIASMRDYPRRDDALAAADLKRA